MITGDAQTPRATPLRLRISLLPGNQPHKHRLSACVTAPRPNPRIAGASEAVAAPISNPQGDPHMPRLSLLSHFAIVLAIFCLAAPAVAAHMTDSDLASLWHQADIVVEGQEQGYKTENYWEHGVLVVSKVHKGQDRVKA